MKRFLMLLTIALTCLSLFTATAEAKRFGGGSTVGKQRTMSPQPAQKAPAAAPAPTPGAAPAAAPAGNKWLGPLAGLAIGAGLGALFMNGGLGGAMGGILMAVLAGVAVMFLISMFRKKQQQPAMQYAGAGAPYHEPQPVQQPLAGGSAAPVAAAASGNIPADFPVESFLRSAKTSFIRLQAANDRKDLNDIREYTTPEMFAEISMQMQERDNSAQKTDVIAINGELLEVVTEGDLAIASVRFTGELRENNGTPESVDEIWHVQKNLRDDKSVWLLAGIQQTTLH
ncbi:MAG TPA: Tim44-like domain-containing protein [Gallionella sp.]|nr:Tim44-like domain-containing protein [Gallionella sp.]